MKTLPELHPGRFLVFVTPYALGDTLLGLAARLAQRGSLRVLDAGNRFSVYPLARAVRRLTPEPLPQVLGRVYLARAFTCYQVLALLGETPTSPRPTLVVDLLSSFYDESVRLDERRRLLQRCLARLAVLSERAVVVASLRPLRPGQQDPTGFTAEVLAAADEVWLPEAPAPRPPELRLFQ